jgi:pyrimidine deaminase RibD-like protein
VKLALLMGDEYVLQQFGRVGNTYAKSALGKVRDHVQKRPYEAKYLLDKMKGHMGELASKAIHSGITEKYTSINTKDGHVEFRSPGGDWLDDNFDKIENTLMRFTVALSAAMNPAAYREEYLKKLYKILAPKNEKDPLSIFAKYAAGELPAAALKSFVRQAQADRKAKKSGEDIVNGHRWRVSLKPELGGGVVEVIAADPIDAKKKAIQQTPDWRFVDAAALTVTRLDEPAAGTSTTASHPEGRGRPNDPTGRYAIVRRDDQRNYGNHVGSEAPDYQFRFTLPDGHSQAQMRSVLSAWAARNAVNAEDYMIVDTTQFAAPASEAPAGSGSVQWNIVADDGETVHTFWNRNVQADANQAALVWLRNQQLANRGPFDVVPVTSAAAPADADTVTYEIYDREDSSPLETFQAANDAAALEFLNQYRSMGPHTLNSQQATAAFGVRRASAAIPGSTLDLQRQRMAAASMAADAEHAASRRTPTPIPGVQDIEPDVAQYTSQPTAPTQWEVYRRSDGVSMFPLDAATQAAAWAEGRTWVQQTSNDTGITLNPADYSVRQRAAVTESVTVIEQRLRQQLDALGNQAPTGPESPPKMPAGTIKVDVSDMYDWYKLGQHISNLKSIDKSTLGKGPPNTVFAFGSEELENMYSHELTNLGLKTHDLDEPGEEDVDESQEITKFGKLDSVLEKCISMIHRGQETDPEKYGRVAACLIDNKNNHTYAINLPGPDGTRRHAERVAIDTHLKRHGRIGPNTIMITTLSPCVNHMSERYGESCTDLLSDYGIEKCYAGWQDPTQHPATDYPFNLQITNNADIFNTCQHIAASFLPQDMADNLNETVNPDCFDPAFNDTQHFDGLTYRATVDEEYGKPVFVIRVLDDNFQQVGLAKFRPSKRGLVSAITSFKPEYQGQGIARNIYAYVRALGNTIVPSRNQLPPGKAMWAAWKKSGDAKHLMTDVAENFADGRNPQDKGDSKRHGIPKHTTLSQLDKIGHGSGRKAQLARWQANMRRGRAK